MSVQELINSSTRVCLDTAPIIYYVERHPIYFTYVAPFFMALDDGKLTGVTSSITLAECLVHPIRLGLSQLQRDYEELITHGAGIDFFWIGENMARQAAELRTRYQISLVDAIQVAVALEAVCDVFLTNDLRLKRVQEIQVVCIEDFIAQS